MAKLIIKGGKKLKGTVKISGSKNATLPIICASLLCKNKVTLENVPDIVDVHTMIEILKHFGVNINFGKNRLEIDASNIKKKEAPDLQVKKMRASILILGPLLSRVQEVKMSFPGGCVLGKRSIHAHIHALEKLGGTLLSDHQKIHIKCKKLSGAKIILPEISVTATENAIMAAVLAHGNTEIRLSATEPHVQDLCHFLNKMGAKIRGIGSNNIKITGVKELKGGTYKIIGDYLEAGTFAIAAAATGGNIEIKDINPDHLDIVWQKLEEIGVKVQIKQNSVIISPAKKLLASKILKTAVYPNFPTDLQAPFAVLLTQCEGVSKIFETLFEGRLNYLFELEMMGARIEFLNPHQALIIGPHKLQGMPISSYDLRAGAAMVIAALIAEGNTEISNIHYIDRGYENFAKKLSSLGAEVKITD